MGNLNKVMLIGRLGKDPELRYTQSGQAVATFSMATTERFKSGEDWQERTEWHRIVVWGRRGEIAAQYLKKGRQAYIEGRLQTRKWTDRNGNDRYTTEIVSRDLQFIDSRRDGDGGGNWKDNEPPPPDDSYTDGTGGGQGSDIPEDDDIPF